MKVEKIFPSDRLAPFIKEYLFIEAPVGAETKTLPDTALIMSFRFRGNVSSKGYHCSTTLPASALAGLRKSVRIFAYHPMTTNLLIVFREGGFSHFSIYPAHEFFEETVSDNHIFCCSEVDRILEQLAESDNNATRIRIIESALIPKLLSSKRDHTIDLAVQRIKERNGTLRMNELATSLNISQDRFEKRFRASMGTSPKQFANIVRLRYVIKKYSERGSLTSAAFDSGYFDQSHFIKNFQSFTGESPTQFFRSTSFW